MNRLIELKNVSKSYNGKTLFHHFNLTIHDGEMVAIVGESGAGKSTLLNIIGLLEECDEGEILYDYESIQPQSYHAPLMMRNYISYLFQNYALVEEMSVYENLLIALKYTKLKKKEKREIIKNALKEVGLANKIDHIIYTLSGGEQQRVALARVFIKESRVILCDEPTGSLDFKNSQIVMQLLLKCKEQGKTIIVVTHDERIAKQCERIIRIDSHE